VKGYPTIYLLAVALATTCLAACLSGCAEKEAVLERAPLVSVRAQVAMEPEIGIVMSSLYLKEQPNQLFTPVPGTKELWLRTGVYVAKIERCNGSKLDNSASYGVRLGPDHLFEFSVTAPQRYYLHCTTTDDGVIYVDNLALLIEPTDS
jgi:hypothetical protein